MGKRNSRRNTKRRNIKHSRRKNNELTKNLLDGGMGPPVPQIPFQENVDNALGSFRFFCMLASILWSLGMCVFGALQCGRFMYTIVCEGVFIRA